MDNSFGFALAVGSLREAKRVGRKEWKNARFVFLVPGTEFSVNRPPLLGIYPEGTQITYCPHIDMVGTDGSVGTWAPSMVDILVLDWVEVATA